MNGLLSLIDSTSSISRRTPGEAWKRYAVAVACVIAGWMLRELLTPLIGPVRLPFVTFFPAVAAATWYGALRPGLLTMALSGLTAWYFFIEPAQSFWSGTSDDFASLAAFLAASGIVCFAVDSMHRAFARMLREVEQRRQAERRLTVTLTSIGDGVITVDAQSRVTFLNPEAERLTGYASARAVGKTLPEVFRIINEETRRTVENPVDQVFRDGNVVGLANHTLLIAEDGTETPIDDSAAPIRDDEGNIAGVVLVFRDVGTQRAAARARAHLAAIVENSGDAIVTKNLQGIIQSWNAGAERLFGYKPEEIIGKSVTVLFPSDRLDEEAGILRRLHEGLPFQRFETIRVAKDGRQIPVSLSISPIRDDEGRIIGASKIIHDISEVVMARNAAEHASRMKDEFLATLSHELRTPLNAVLGYATLMRMGSLNDAEFDEAAEIIERNARAQAQLIEDLLDMNRIVSGKISLDIQRVSVADVVNAALGTVRPTAEVKGVRIPQAVRSTAVVRADPSRLQQVVWNLLTNAVKFTPEGGEVRVEVRHNDRVEIVVGDTGQGIDAEFLPYVFERFRQADATNTRRHGGLGLGLAIVRNLVELQGGTVRAASEGPNRGSEFTVSLPSADAVDRRASIGDTWTSDKARVRPPSDADLSAVRVLVVDDDRDAVALVERTLRKYGAEVVTAASAGEAVERLSEKQFDVLLSDISMPDEDGYSLIRRVREREQGRLRMPAAALTALAGAADRERALAAGFDLHLAKPIEPAKLPTVIADLVRRNWSGY